MDEDERGEQLTRDDVVEGIGMSHVEKQRHGASMFSIDVDRSTLEALTRGREGDPEAYEKAGQRVLGSASSTDPASGPTKSLPPASSANAAR